MKPTAYVINLDRRKDRWQRTQELWSPFFELVRVPATDTADGARGCKMSHANIAEVVLGGDYKMMIVIEDDAEPTPHMGTIGLQCIEEAQRHIHKWDSANLSPLLDLSALRMPCAKLTPTESPLFLRTNYSHSTNMVLYNYWTLPILRDSLTSHYPIDMYLARHCRCQWVPRCLLATQPFEDSDIRKPFEWQKTAYERSAEMLKQFTPETESCDSKASSQ